MNGYCQLFITRIKVKRPNECSTFNAKTNISNKSLFNVYMLVIDLTGMSKKIVAHYLDPLEYINILGSLKMFLAGKVPLMTY